MEVVNHCLICLENSKLSTLDCTCSICLDCLKQYTKIQIEEFWTSDGTHLHMKCPGGCKKILYFDQIQDLAIQNHFITDIHGQLFKSYCKKSLDVQQCPNKNCEFYFLKPCNRKCVDICEICQTRIQAFESFSCSSVLNQITEFYTTHECPRCEVKIMKNGGCSHMTCQVCKFEFCWDCNQNCIGHDWSICIYHNIFTLIIKAQLLYTLLFSLGLDTLLRGVISWIFEVTYLFILNNLILLITGLIVVQIKKLNEKYQKITYHRIVFATILLIIIIFIEYFIIEFTIKDWVYYMAKELLYLSVLVIIITIINQLTR